MAIRPIIHIDCDGPMSEFDQSALNLIKRFSGREYLESEITEWDVFKSFDLSDKEWWLEYAIKYHDFCLNLPPVPGARKGLDELREFCDVYALTAPYHVPEWLGQRDVWLKNVMGFDKDHIIQTHAKFLSFGHVFLDDRLKNLVKWQNFWNSAGIKARGILWNRPGNQTDVWSDRVSTWPEFVEVVRKIANEP